MEGLLFGLLNSNFTTWLHNSLFFGQPTYPNCTTVMWCQTEDGRKEGRSVLFNNGQKMEGRKKCFI